HAASVDDVSDAGRSFRSPSGRDTGGICPGRLFDRGGSPTAPRPGGACCGPTTLYGPRQRRRSPPAGRGAWGTWGADTRRQERVDARPRVSAEGQIFDASDKRLRLPLPRGRAASEAGNGREFTAKAGDMWSCNKGLGEDVENIGAGVAVMRAIDLLPT